MDGLHRCNYTQFRQAVCVIRMNYLDMLDPVAQGWFWRW